HPYEKNEFYFWRQYYGNDYLTQRKKDWLVAIRLNAKDGSAIVDDLKKAGLQVTHSDESGAS
ncbi:MAG: hypothetical protein P8X67_20935, partial [Syntrophobacterales bacterium]